jgi:hypothetical protein
MGIALNDDVKKLVDRPNFAHRATIRWLAAECIRSGLLAVTSFIEAGSLKGRNTERDPRGLTFYS